MSLNIKNDEICTLATMTGAITVALRERLKREQRKRSVASRARKLRAIVERCATLQGPVPSVIEHGDLLYADRGLAKVIVDSYALLAVLNREPDADRFQDAILTASPRHMSVANMPETSTIAAGRRL